MQELVREYLSNVKSRRKRRRRITITIAVFAVLVVGSVVWSLARMGIAMTGDPKCGLEEHTHSDACYTDTLVCGQEESAGHTHTDACYQTESVLTCGMEESEEHVHDESCYTTSQTLICGQEESAGHTHTDACYEKTLSCGKAEHTHTENCFIDSGADVEDASAWDAQYADVEWKDAWGEDLVTAAQMQVGYKESTKNYIVAEDGSHKGYTRYGQFAGDAYADWDAPFVNFCLHYAGLEASNMFPNEKATAEWYDTFVKANEQNQNYLTAPAGYDPKPGDIIFFHKEGEETDTQMGIVSSYDKEKNEIKVIEGNSSNEVKENKYDIGDEHISSYLMVTGMEKTHKPSDAGNAEEGKTETPEDTSKVFTTEENKEETWAYEKSYEDNTIVIHVKAGEGVVPEGAELSVTPIEQKEVTDEMTEEEAAEVEKVNEQYELTSQKLQEESEKKQETLEGFLAYDICFIVDGEEVEPSGDVKVTMDFKEAVKPEGVSENAVVAVNHLKEDESAADGIVVEDLTAKADTTIATAEATVEKVELVAESFSTFVITWGATNIWEIDVKYVDQFGVEFVDVPEAGSETKKLEINPNDIEGIVSLERLLVDQKILKNGECTYQRIEAQYIMNGYENKVEVDQVSYLDDTYLGRKSIALYCSKNWNTEVDLYYAENLELHVVYQKDGLRTVETVDSSNTVDIKMIDYDSSKNSNYQWSPFDGDTHASNVQSGLLSDKLSDDGYPTFKASGLHDTQNNKSIDSTYSLKNLFSGNELKSANHLFIKKEFDATGDYYYNSAETAAVFDKNSGNFTVYNELVVPYYKDNLPGYHSGNFLPYNTISNKQRAQEGLPFYLPDGSNIKWNAAGEYVSGTTANYHFGMEMSADFLQPKDGLRNGTTQPIRYEFDGDDDLWVYIDGVLVLDIGGIHPAQSGYIDFSTGEVVVNGVHQYYLKERFKAVLNSGSATPADKQKFENMEWNGNTFADYTAHTFKMWYMERGAGASDLKVRFNLPAIEKNTINVTKRLKDENNNYIFNSTEEFGFRVYYKEKEGEEYQILTDPTLISVPGRTVTIGTGLNEDTGVFTLKPEETATVQLPAEATYYVEEVNLNVSQYSANDVEIYSTATGRENPSVDGANVKSEEANVNSRKAVIFTNHKKGADKPVTKVQFEKKWDDFGNDYETRPENVTVALHGEIQKDGEVIDINDTDSNWMSENVKDYQKTLTASEQWKWEWNELPSHYRNENDDDYKDQDGNPINYPISWTVKEVGTITPYQAEPAIEENSSDSSTKCMSITNKINVDWQMVKRSETDKSKTLKGAEFELKSAQLPNNTLATGESKNDDGIITWTPVGNTTWDEFKKSLDGDYIITESKAPNGYVKRGVSWKVKFIKGVPKVEGADFKKYDSTNNRTVEIYIENSILYALPGTGGSGIYWYMFSGILLMAVAVLITYKKRRKGVLRS